MTVHSAKAEQLALKRFRDETVFGITHWYARYRLPNATQSDRPAITNLTEDSLETSDISVVQTAHNPDVAHIATTPSNAVLSKTAHPVANTTPKKSAALQGGMSDEKTAKTALVDSVPAVELDSSAVTATVTSYSVPCEPFKLMVVQSGSVLMVDTVGGNVDSLTETLIQKLASAILNEFAGPSSDMVVRSFQWPLFDHQYAPRDEASARVVFTEFIQEFVGSVAVTSVLLCGDTALRYTQLNSDGKITLPDGSQLTPVVTNRLSSLLYSAADKRDLWSKLMAATTHG